MGKNPDRFMPEHKMTEEEKINKQLPGEFEELRAARKQFKKDELLEAMNLFSSHFLRESPEKWKVNQFLAMVGKIIEISRIIIFENHRDEKADLRSLKRYEWISPEMIHFESCGDVRDFSYNEEKLDRWLHEFENGNAMSGNIREFPATEKNFLNSQKVKSVLCIPIFSSKQLWGYIRFDQCLTEHMWSKPEVDALKTAAAILGAVFEHKNVVKKLKYTNDILENILQHTLLKIAYMDKDFNFIRVNRLYAQADGHVPEYFIGKNHFDLYPNKDNEKIFQTVVDVGEPHIELARPFEYADHPERGVTYWDWSLIPVKDENGKVDALILSLQDVTQRVRAQIETVRSDEQYKRLVCGLPDIIYIFSSLRGALFWSPRVFDVLGFTPEDLMQKPYLWHDAIHREDIIDVDESIKRAGMGMPFDIKYRIKDFRGNWHWFNDRSITVRRNDNETIIEGIASDITEKTKAEEELQYQKEFENTILKAERNIVTVNDGNQLKYANPAFFKFFSEYATLDEFLKNYNCICDLFEKTEQEGYIYDGKDGLNWLEYIEQNPRDFYRVLVNHGGERYRFILTIERMEFRDTIRNVCNLTDVTELEEYRSYLEQKVNREVERRLQSEKMMIHQAKLAAMGDLTSRIAHHWRQPLSSFSVALENMRESFEAGEVTKENYGKIIDEIIDQVHHMSELISKFHYYFRTDTEIRDFSIKESVEETVSFFLNSVPEGRFDLKLIIKNDKNIRGIPRDFGYAILSILNNAKDAMELRRIENPRINIGIDEIEDRTRILVRDNGGGIDNEILDRIFEPYYTTKFPSVGTGMGLYVVRNIIEEQMNGKISVENSDEGAVFTILV